MFGNTSDQVITVQPLRVTMKSQTHGGAATPAYIDVSLSPKQTKKLTVTYDSLPNPPFSWIYAKLSGGNSVTLATYIP